MDTDLDVAVIGAGISGLALAYRLQQAGRRVHVFEAADAVGGRMRSLRQDGHVIDTGAEMLSDPGYEATWELIRELGVPGKEVPRLPAAVALWRGGRAHPNVGRPLGLLTGAGLSWRGRLDLLRFQAWVGRRSRAFDPDRPEHTPVGDLTVAAVAERYSAELRDYTFEPLAGGFFGWQLDRSAAAPLICLLLATRSTTNWHTYRHGMDDLARRLAERVDVTTGCRVHEVVSAHEAARIVTDNGVLTARRAVLCVPAPVALGLHANVAEDERPYLQASTYAPMLRVSCLLDQPLSARGGGRAYIIALPAAENRVLSGLTLDHTKPARAPAGRGLVSLLTRPHATRELIDASDDEIVHRLTEEGERYLPGLRRAIRASVVSRFGHGLPEATPAALRLRSGFLQRPTRTVEYAGDWLACRPNCEGAVRSAALACRRVLDGTSRAPRRFPATTRR